MKNDKKVIKKKKKFSWKRLAKRFLIVSVILGLILFLAFKYTKNTLKENGIQYSELSYSFPLSLEVKQFTIDIDEFQLILKDLKLDLSFANLFSGKFTGKNFFAKDLYIIYTFVEEEDVEEEPFNFDFMPYLSFEDVRIENTIIRTIDSTDFSIMTFPIVTASDFIWNDSIYAKQVNYSNGTIAFLQPFTSDSTDTSQTEIAVIPYVPHFYADEFNADSLDFILTSEESVTKVTNIDFRVNGWNNIPGIDLEIQHLYLTIQDTLDLKIKDSRFLLETDESLAIQDFNIRLPGVDFNLNEFTIEDIDSSYAYSIDLAESHFSPRYAKYFGAEEFIKTDAPDISLQLKANYFKDTLNLQKFNCLLANKTQIIIDGMIAQPSGLGYVNLNLTEINITENDLKQYFDVDAPESMVDLNINSKLNIEGNKSQLTVKGKLDVDELKTHLNISINNILEEKMDANIQVSSPFVASSMFTNEKSNPAKAYGINLSTHIQQFTFEDIHDIKIDVKIDSIKNNDYQYDKIDLTAQYKNKISTILMESNEDDWNLSLSTNDDPFDWDTLHFSGYTHVNTKNLAQFDIQEGKIDSDFKGVFYMDDEVILFNMNLDSLLFENEERMYTDNLELNFFNKHNDYSIKIQDSSNVKVLFEFNEDLIDWTQSKSLAIDSIPDFGLNFSLTLDSSFVKDLAGINAEAIIKNITLKSSNEKLHGDVNIPFIQYDDFFLKQIDGLFIFNDLKEVNSFHIDTLSTPFIYLNDISSIVTFKEKINAFEFKSDAFLPKIQDSIGINTAFQVNEDLYKIIFDSLRPQKMGESYWYSKNSDEINIYKKDYQILGNLSFTSGVQSISTSIKEKEIDFNVDSLNLGDILYYYIPSDSIQSTLNLSVNYEYNNSAINGKGSINQIVIDTIDIGNVTLNIDYFDDQQFADVLYKHDIGYLDVHTFDLYNEPSFEADISKVDLKAILKLVGIDSLLLEAKGYLTGNFDGKYTDSLLIGGYLEFDSTEFNSPNYGFKSSINKQRITVDHNKVELNNFSILDQNKKPLIINGSGDIFNPEVLNAELYTDHFTLMHNDKNNGAIKGEFNINSRLNFTMKNDALTVSGYVNTLDGNSIEYLYESKVKLEDRSETVAFITFEETEEKIEVQRKKYNIDYDVDLNIGNTEIYVLLSKTANEYFRLNCFGEINLETGNQMTPNAFGKLESIGGHVYYEVPLISDIQLNIKKANVNWSGNLFNPKITFLGEEIFRVFPNEISSELSKDGERVPVAVDVEINDHSVNDIVLNFNIKSNNPEVQNYLSTLTQNTRSDYAVSMLVYGKVNQGSESTKSGYESVVNKLNEISRRNFKNMDLSFRVEKYKNDPTAKKENYNKIGVDLSRNFMRDKLRVSAGGSMDVNNSQNNSPLSGYAKITYQLRKKPDVYLMTSHTSNYQGPLIGRVDQSSVGVEVNFEFDNLFKRNKKKDKND